MKLKSHIDVTVEITDSGYSAYTEHSQGHESTTGAGVFTTGEDITELHANLVEALKLAYEDAGVEITADNLRLTVDLQQFFQHYKVLNAKFLAKKIGMNPTLLSQYVRGRKRPSLKQADKIMRGIQRIGRELAEIRLVSA